MADRVFVLGGAEIGWDVERAFAPLGDRVKLAADVDGLLEALLAELVTGDEVVLMSNGGFGGLPSKLEQALHDRGRARVSAR